jgi:hypothetical protein
VSGTQKPHDARDVRLMAGGFRRSYAQPDEFSAEHIEQTVQDHFINRLAVTNGMIEQLAMMRSEAGQDALDIEANISAGRRCGFEFVVPANQGARSGAVNFGAGIGQVRNNKGEWRDGRRLWKEP